MRRMVLLGSAVTALVVGVCLVASASADRNRPIPQAVTFHFKSTNTAAQFVDTDPPGTSLGDAVYSANVLRSHGDIAGRLNAECHLIRREALCQATIWIHGGQLELEGQLPVSYFQAASAHPPMLAITGGTGAFQYAHGYAVFGLPSNGVTDLTLYVTP